MSRRSRESWRPFADVATERKAELGVSFRELERRTKELDGGRGMSAAHLLQLFHGNEDPVLRTILLVAGALQMPPDDFIEYRLHHFRASLDERLDFDRAVQSYELIASSGPELPEHLGADTPNTAGGRGRYAAAS